MCLKSFCKMNINLSVPNPQQNDICGFTSFDLAHTVRGWISFLNATLWLPKKQLYCAIDLIAEALLMLRLLRFRAMRGQCHCGDA